MQIKLFELRDKGTFIPLCGVRLLPTNASEHYLIRRGGWEDSVPYYLFNLQASKIGYEFFDRTYSVALNYVKENWNEIKSGSVIDIQNILGETSEVAISERHII